MTREQFKVLVKAMKAVYTNPGFIPDQDAFDVWYSMLKDLDYALASRAVQMHLQTEESSPTVAGIRKQSVKLKADESDDLNETAAWSLVLKAIRNSAYHAEDEYKKLPEAVKRAVHAPGQLREWALLDNVDGKTLTVLQSNFQRAYRAEVQKEKENKKLSPDLQNRLKLNAKQKHIEAKEENVNKLEDSQSSTRGPYENLMEEVKNGTGRNEKVTETEE